MNYILFDDDKRLNFLPLTYTRPVSELFYGTCTNRERWEMVLGAKTSYLVPMYLSKKFPTIIHDDNILINARLFADADSLKDLDSLKPGQKIIYENEILGARIEGKVLEDALKREDSAKSWHSGILIHFELKSVTAKFHALLISNVWDLFVRNEDFIKKDARRISDSNFSDDPHKSNTVFGSQLFVHKKASVRASVLNSESGPIVVDEGAEIMEGCSIRGPVYIGENAVVKIGAKIYGPTSIGNFSKVGGEINNSVVSSFSNKAHDGFMGNSVIGEWCNLGADTNTSNLKNDYSEVKLWHFGKNGFVKTGRQFLGLIMGDHSKCGINTMFNTGAVVGVSANVYGAGYQPNHIPSFSWGQKGSFETYKLEKALKVADVVMKRRDLHLSGDDELILKSVFEQSEQYRTKFL